MSFRPRRNVLRLLAAAVCGLVLSVATAAAQNAPTPQPGQQAPGQAGAQGGGPGGAARPPAPNFHGQTRIRVLMVAGGCCHDYPAQGAILMKMFQDSLPIDWTFHYNNWRANRDLPTLYSDPNWFRGYDLIVHNDCTTPPDSVTSDQYMANVAAANRAGIPSVVIHCAMHTFRDDTNDAWRMVQGVHSRRHTPSHRIGVKVLQPSHPVMSGIPTDWVTPVDELYILERVWPYVTPLASGVDPADNREHALAWVHQNNARVFGTSVGHGMDTWNDPVYQRLLRQGIRWALGR